MQQTGDADIETASPSNDLVPTLVPDRPVAMESGKNLPALAPDRTRKNARRWQRLVFALVLLAGAVGGTGYWWSHRTPPLPVGISTGNGRIEADPIDIATKFAGRIAELRVDEGDKVSAGQVLAVMDTRDLETSLKKSEAQAELAKRAIGEANANLNQQHSQVVLAQQQMDRSSALLKEGWVTKEVYDQRQQVLQAAQAGELAAHERVIEAEHALDAANHDAELYRVNIADNTLVAPRNGRIAYRIANTGEVLSAGGKVFTMLDIGYVYMDVYLPTLAAGRVKIGDDARIVLDAYPDTPIPAKVTFMADQAQFTPKMVETQTERDKLMFRIRVRIDPARSSAHADVVRSGLPGVAYVLTDPKIQWPARLQVRQ
jgi:HlyD family secretion protein